MKKKYGSADSETPSRGSDRPSSRQPGDSSRGAPAGEPESPRLEDAIRDLPDLDPPGILLPSVMDSVRRTRLPLWVRCARWAASPRSITFTPLRALPVAAVLIAVTVALTYYALRPGGGSLDLPDGRVPVMLALQAPDARRVAVIGSFNGWRAQDLELQTLDGEKRWVVILMLPAGRHEYAFVVDGERILPDPAAGFHEEDGFGNLNAVLYIGNGNGNSI